MYNEGRLPVLTTASALFYRVQSGDAQAQNRLQNRGLCCIYGDLPKLKFSLKSKLFKPALFKLEYGHNHA